MQYHLHSATFRQAWTALGFALCAACLTVGCVPHVAPYKPKVRNFKADEYDPVVDRRQEGSLWNDSADTLFTYRRSSHIGDLITIVIDESANANRSAGTDLSRSSDVSFGISSFAGAMSALAQAHPSIDPKKLVEAMSKNDFSGKGATSSSGALRATLTTRIKRVLPNGDLYVEGSKVVMVNDEESHIYLSGVVRSSDIQADNSVESNLLADAQVEYTGRGPLSDKQKPGWFARVLDWISPF